MFIGELSALITAFLWSGTSMVFTAATMRIGVTYVNVTRLILALIYLSVSIAIMGLSVNLSAVQIEYLALSGVIGLVLGDSFLFRAFKEIGARISMLIMSLVPAMTAILAYVFLGETMTPAAIIGMVVTITGISLVVLKAHEDPSATHKLTRIGVLCAVLGAAGQAIGLILAKQAFMLGEIHGFVATFVRILTSVIVLTPIAMIFGRYRAPLTAFRQDKKAMFYTFVGSIIGPYLGITFSLIAIAHTNVAIASTIMATPPIIMLPLVRYFYKDKLSWSSIIGATVAVLGVAILFWR
jgi:drug/metabolite transporter (DMT)-like permease